MSMNELVQKQQQLMDKVPHDLKDEAFVKMAGGVKVIDALLRYLNSTGHKPWRPNPLARETQNALIAELEGRVGFLHNLHYQGIAALIAMMSDTQHPDMLHYKRQLVSAFGVIEETVEYLDTLTNRDKTEHDKLEELVDQLFFWMEQLILSGFSWDQVEQEYGRKWEENMERYRRAKEGDYGWDKRSEQRL